MRANHNSKLNTLYKELKETIKKKDDAVSSEHYEKATFLRQKELAISEKIAALEKTNKVKNLPVISEQDIALIVSKWTGIPVTNLDLQEKNRYLNLEKTIKKHIIGQDSAVEQITSAIKRSRVGISNPNRPMGSFIFLGPTGVGKTELVKVLAREIFGSEKSLVKIDMSEFMEKHNVSRLVGAPAGYIGYEEGGQLTERVRRQPYSIVLFDEIEKAHPDVFNILLQIMEDGELTDAKGRKVNFRNTLIVLTSNLGTDLLNSSSSIGFNDNINSSADSNRYQKMAEKVNDSIEKHFKPEFINRLDGIIIFKPLNEKTVEKIAKLELNKLKQRLQKNEIFIDVSDKLVKWLAQKGYKPDYGARPMRKIISDTIENPLSELILRGEYVQGNKIFLDISADQVRFNIN